MYYISALELSNYIAFLTLENNVLPDGSPQPPLDPKNASCPRLTLGRNLRLSVHAPKHLLAPTLSLFPFQFDTRLACVITAKLETHKQSRHR